MKTFNVPYAKGFVDINIPDQNIAGVLESKAHSYKAELSQEALVEHALDNPIGSQRLEELVKGKSNMVIITSDHTRPVPSKITMPILLRRIREANPSIDITILLATGFHRPTTHEEMVDKFGPEIVANEKIVNHISGDASQMTKIGVLPSGGDCIINKLAVETELLISEGFIEPHFFAGFSGGRKSVLPGIASEVTVMANHCAEFINSPYARTGIIENNPIHKDMVYAGRTAKLAFILNVVIDAEKHIINAFAGDMEQAHETGCAFVSELASVKACNDGHGGESLYENLKNAKTPRELLDRIAKVPRNETIPDQWEMQILARILDQFTVIVVTDQCDPKMLTDMHLQHASTFDEALNKALELKGKDASITVIPDGVSVVVKA